MKKRERMTWIVAITSCLVMFLSSMAYSFEFEVEMDNFVFLPHGTRIHIGDMITWRNRDVAQHSATSDSGVWDSGLLARGQTFSYTFTTSGAYPYHCSLHTSMKDTIFVATPTGVDESNLTPAKFELAQNYPNPFNAQTTIQYNVPIGSHVSLEIYNILGQNVASLVDDFRSAGRYQTIWNASNVPSGIYFYRIHAGALTETKKMSFLK